MKENGSVLLLIACVLFTGCASIVGKSAFPVTINSNPSEANIVITDEKGTQIFAGTTPTTIKLSAGESYFHAKIYYIAFSKPGYVEQRTELRATISGWYFGNFIFGGLIGMLIVDPITGKMWKLPTTSMTNLSAETALNTKPALQILTLDQISPDMRKNLISLN